METNNHCRSNIVETYENLWEKMGLSLDENAPKIYQNLETIEILGILRLPSGNLTVCELENHHL